MVYKHYIASNCLQVKIAWHLSVTNGIGAEKGKNCQISHSGPRIDILVGSNAYF